MSEMTVRRGLAAAVRGEEVSNPVFAVYDWFVRNRPDRLDRASSTWASARSIMPTWSDTGGRTSISWKRRSMMAGVPRRDVYWITDIGELHEWYLGEWRQEYLIKSAADYRIMQRAWTDVEVLPWDKPFLHSEQAVGDSGITVGQLDRTPFQKIQIDYAGLARFSYDIADRLPELLDLLDLMTDVKLREFRMAVGSPARQIKLWENLSIETMGPRTFRRYLVPVYRKIFEILDGSGQALAGAL